MGDEWPIRLPGQVELNVLQVVADFHGNAWVPNLQISRLNASFLVNCDYVGCGYGLTHIPFAWRTSRHRSDVLGSHEARYLWDDGSTFPWIQTILLSRGASENSIISVYH